jgi:hypothetical protein
MAQLVCELDVLGHLVGRNVESYQEALGIRKWIIERHPMLNYRRQLYRLDVNLAEMFGIRSSSISETRHGPKCMPRKRFQKSAAPASAASTGRTQAGCAFSV